MTETAKTVGTTPRCGHETSTGACVRPAGHPKTGHMSLANRDAKTRTGAQTPEEMAAKEAERAAKAQERIKAATDAHAAKVAKLQEAAAALGFKLVPMSAKEKKDAAKAAEAAAATE
jgi:hypothetical protein